MWLLLACRGFPTADPTEAAMDTAQADTAGGRSDPLADLFAPGEPPPIPGVALGQVTAGAHVRLTVAPVRPGAAVRVAWSPAPGTTCREDLCLDLAGPVSFLGAAVAGPDGYAELTLAVPSGLPEGRELHLQALVDDPTGTIVSTVFLRRTGPAACGQTYEAVCGWDGQTWPNRCAAWFSGWVVRDDGPC